MLYRRGNDETLEERHWKEGACNSVIKWKVPSSRQWWRPLARRAFLAVHVKLGFSALFQP